MCTSCTEKFDLFRSNSNMSKNVEYPSNILGICFERTQKKCLKFLEFLLKFEIHLNRLESQSHFGCIYAKSGCEWRNPKHSDIDQIKRMRKSKDAINTFVAARIWASTWLSFCVPSCYVPGNEERRRNGYERSNQYMHGPSRLPFRKNLPKTIQFANSFTVIYFVILLIFRIT